MLCFELGAPAVLIRQTMLTRAFERAHTVQRAASYFLEDPMQERTNAEGVAALRRTYQHFLFTDILEALLACPHFNAATELGHVNRAFLTEFTGMDHRGVPNVFVLYNQMGGAQLVDVMAPKGCTLPLDSPLHPTGSKIPRADMKAAERLKHSLQEREGALLNLATSLAGLMSMFTTKAGAKHLMAMLPQECRGQKEAMALILKVLDSEKSDAQHILSLVSFKMRAMLGSRTAPLPQEGGLVAMLDELVLWLLGALSKRNPGQAIVDVIEEVMNPVDKTSAVRGTRGPRRKGKANKKKK